MPRTPKPNIPQQPVETLPDKISPTDLAMRSKAMNNLQASEQNYHAARQILALMDQAWTEMYQLNANDQVDVTTGFIQRAPAPVVKGKG